MFQYDKVFCNIISQNFDAVYSIFMINTYFTIGKAKKDRPETESNGTVVCIQSVLSVGQAVDISRNCRLGVSLDSSVSRSKVG